MEILPIITRLKALLQSASAHLFSFTIVSKRTVLTYHAQAKVLETLDRQNEEFRQRIRLLSAQADAAIEQSRLATARAEEYERLYRAELEDHKRSLKSEANWFALSTSTRTPLHDGVGPTRPVPRDDPAHQAPVGHVKARDAALAQTREMLEKAEAAQLRNLSNDLDRIPDEVYEMNGKDLADALWQSTNPGKVPPWSGK